MTQLANPLHSATVGGLPVVFGSIVAEGAGTTGVPKFWRAANASGDYGDARVVLYDAVGNPLLVADDAAFAIGTTRVMPMGALADETSPDSVDEGDVGVPRMTLARVLRTVPSNGSGVDLLPNAAALADGAAVPTTTTVGAALLGYNGATEDQVRMGSASGGALGTAGALAIALHAWDPGGTTYRPVRTANGSGDGLAGASNPITAAYVFNNATWDRQRSNTSETALASAARTAATLSGALVNYEGRGIQVDVNVTAKAAATTLTVQLISTGNRVIAEVTALAAVAGVQYAVQFYPGVLAADFEGTTGKGKSVAVPRNYKLQVVPSDASSVTYDVAVQAIK